MSAVLSQVVEQQAVLNEALPVAPWARELRREGLARFQGSGFPTTRQENWKYTSVRSIERGGFAPWMQHAPDPALSAADIAALQIADFDAWRVIFVNGYFRPELSTLPTGGGITCTNLRETLNADTQVSQYLKPWLAAADDGFQALNTAFLGEGLHIDAMANTEMDRPIYVLFAFDHSATPVAAHPRLLITAGSNARITVLEHFAGTQAANNFTNAVTQVHLQDGAHLSHYRLQEEGLAACHVAAVTADLDKDSRLDSHNLHLGAALSRADIHARLNGRGAHVTLNGFYLANGRQHTDTHTLVDHLEPDTTSDEEYRGVLNDRGRAVFNGKAVVHPGAVRIDAQQANHNLLLSDQAEVDTKPELEIYADDVKCSHGATVGALDEDALFYLRSRGLDEATARAILTFAFADEVLKRVALPAVRQHVEQRVLAALPQSDTIREFL